ncbi:heavy metal translocating P-type ATPase metal-binding domain-containing protein [Gillisia sp. M10.2A]|uniref:Heavy metal translocating P-type ATPase metal-binding domain-containing protein n=1 Tax=Gillisia lutea TaxID=2909668 RepID=A0ABS9EEY4_9FLAO|nr:heavy metal translocating P-type ATPase metal-binding domain-containing protein [Gillisia lutea]MCF4101411.1 heavy metal translocating P-type ATPase metal-binding domain-containing protein [Gillisia lutea]
MDKCYHCGDNCSNTAITHLDKVFCCNGCKTVFDILQENDLSYYYNLDESPGTSPSLNEAKFNFLENEAIVERLLEFNEQDTQVVSFIIPSIHCSSCIWVLENLSKIDASVKNTQVNFPEKSIRITYNSEQLSLKNLVVLLCRIGYEPSISLDDFEKKEKKVDRSLIYKLGVAGFAFGNIMFLSFPEYFEVNEFWLEKFKYIFRWLMFAFSLPVVFYSGRDYFISAYKGLRSKILNIDVPIAIGISVLFIRSTAEIIFDLGTGFFDSLAGLIFFLLLGRFFQQKTYAFLSFERDYKSYFPIAVTRIFQDPEKSTSEEQAQIYDLKTGDRILIRNSELIPVDSILIKGSALIDYSFVTGEAEPVAKRSGDKLFAGGKQQAGIIELEVIKPVEQSYLTQLWSNEIFSKTKQSNFQSLTDRISKKFTIGILSIAFIATLFWMIADPSKALNVFTAVLIVACPCAIALAAPFTLGNLLRIFGRHKLYIKDTSVIEQMSHIDTVVFDKTGTLTSNTKNLISYEGITLTEQEITLLTSTLRASNHPLSRSLYKMLQENDIETLDEFEEEIGKGISGTINQDSIRIGSFDFVESSNPTEDKLATKENYKRTEVHISSNNTYKGCYIFYNQYRNGIQEIFDRLKQHAEIIILSGDNDGEKRHLEELLPKDTQLLFNQKPKDKLEYIKQLQKLGRKVMMVGDGLNDSGALAQSNVGIVISENINVFSPACDGILDASRFKDLYDFVKLSRKGVSVIKWSFLFSLFYNIIGLLFAITGNLAPVVAAILMPLSSISIVIFTTVATNILGRKLMIKKAKT